jgi:hypothetical protein
MDQRSSGGAGSWERVNKQSRMVLSEVLKIKLGDSARGRLGAEVAEKRSWL